MDAILQELRATRSDIKQLTTRIENVEAGTTVSSESKEPVLPVIPKPKGEAGRVKNDPKHPGFQLKKEMGVDNHTYKAIRDFIRAQVITFQLPLETYKEQDDTIIAMICKKVAERFQLKYQGEWAFKKIIQGYLRSRKAYKRLKNTDRDVNHESMKVSSKQNVSKEEHATGSNNIPKPNVFAANRSEDNVMDSLEALSMQNMSPPDCSEDEFIDLFSSPVKTEKSTTKARPKTARPKIHTPIFADNKGWFYWGNGELIETDFTEKPSKTYFLPNDAKIQLFLDNIPCELNNFRASTTFISQEQNAFGHFDVGYIPQEYTLPLAPISSLLNNNQPSLLKPVLSWDSHSIRDNINESPLSSPCSTPLKLRPNNEISKVTTLLHTIANSVDEVFPQSPTPTKTTKSRKKSAPRIVKNPKKSPKPVKKTKQLQPRPSRLCKQKYEPLN